MIVIGIKMKPAEALATAPVVKFARFESFGKDEEYVGSAPFSTTPMVLSRFDRATCWRRALRLVKYIADPKPVRRAEGKVPRQNAVMEFGDLEISRMVVRREVEPDCCTRVLRRSAG